jgi:uncharacterized tellurite resistance protein B-like protein
MGTLAQQFESGQQSSEKGHFRNLVLIARFDGKIEDSERALLMRIAQRLSLTDEQVKEIFDHSENYPIIPPYSREERYERYIQLLQMALSDGKMDSAQENFVRKLGVSLGFSSETITEKTNVIIDKLRGGMTRDEVLENIL